jgi:luciferase family oxidoreductase group 1
MIPFSILDLSPITAGSNAATSLRNTLDLAQHAERLGYRRFWLAEHHSIPSVASAATAVVIGHVAAGTRTIRVGAGGIMLPNHAPLVIAEQFGTLESLFPGRIDLGLGRAPGSDQATARALRRTLASDPEQFPQDVLELMNYFQPTEQQRVQAIPGIGLHIPIWILGSSLFGATFAAAAGLPFSFASHFAPAQMMEAIEIYRARFRPGSIEKGQIDKPYVMLGFNVFAADSDAEAQLLSTSMQQAFVNLRSGRPSPLQPPLPGYEQSLSGGDRALLAGVLSCSAIGAPNTVCQRLQDFIARTQPDEIIITCQMFDHAARVRSFEIAAAAMATLGNSF